MLTTHWGKCLDGGAGEGGVHWSCSFIKWKEMNWPNIYMASYSSGCMSPQRMICLRRRAHDSIKSCLPLFLFIFRLQGWRAVFIFLECLYLFVVGNSVNCFGGLAIWFKRQSIHGVSAWAEAEVEASARSGFGFICSNEMFSLWTDLTYSWVYSWFWRRLGKSYFVFSPKVAAHVW